MLTDLQAWRMRWDRAGFRTIPLQPFSKLPQAGESWKGAPGLQWQAVERDRSWQSMGGNVGLVLGHGLAVIDCDDKASADQVRAELKQRLAKVVEVKTPSGGRHFYIRVQGAPAGFNWARLAIGAGELRVNNCYVAAVGSRTLEGKYRFVSGSPEDVPRLPALRWSDLSWLIAPQGERYNIPGTLEAPPVRLLRRKMPRPAEDLLHELRSLAKGQPLGKYATRSEAEAGVITMLILAGWGLEDIKSLFDVWQPGHYAEIQDRHKSGYLGRVYSRALYALASDPTRQEIAEAYQTVSRAETIPVLKRFVLLGLLAIAWQLGTWQPRAAQRDLKLYADCSRSGAAACVRWLQAAGYVQSGRRGTCQHGTEYKINLMQISSISNKKEEIEKNTLDSLLFQQLASLYPAKARNVLAVYRLLSANPQSLAVLTEAGNFVPSTVIDALYLLERFGLAGRVNLPKRAPGPGRAPLGWVIGADLQPPQDNQRAREGVYQERDDWHEYHLQAVPSCDGTCLPGDRWALPKGQRRRKGRGLTRRGGLGQAWQPFDPVTRWEKQHDPAARFEALLDQQTGDIGGLGWLPGPDRDDPIPYYRPAIRPDFCPDCGGREFWQLNSGRFMCCSCRPEPGGYVHRPHALPMTKKQEAARRALLLAQAQALEKRYEVTA